MTLDRSAVTGGAKVGYAVKDVPAFTDTEMTTKVYHGVSIVAGTAGAGIVGRIQSWQPTAYNRDGVHLYELANISFGRPVEYVPGKSTGYTIAVTRAEVWSSEMELAFGFATVFDDLIDQTKPFTVREFWLKGSASYHTITYNGCWFTEKNIDALTVDGDGVTKISANLAYVSRKVDSAAAAPAAT